MEKKEESSDHQKCELKQWGATEQEIQVIFFFWDRKKSSSTEELSWEVTGAERRALKQRNIWDGIIYFWIRGEGPPVEIQVRFNRDQVRGVSIWIAFSGFDNVFVLFSGTSTNCWTTGGGEITETR